MGDKIFLIITGVILYSAILTPAVMALGGEFALLWFVSGTAGTIGWFYRYFEVE